MSNPEFDRHGDWRRWQMDELTTANSTLPTNRAPVPTEHQRKVEAAQRAAEEARAREEQERQEIYERIRQAAEEEGYQAGLARGHEEGYAQGLSEGREHAAQELNAQIRQSVTPLAALAKQFSDALEKIDETIAHDLAELALATGKQLAGDALEAHPEHILAVVRELLHTEPPLVGKQRLWLNPTDHEQVSEHLGSELEAANWTLQPDDQLARGGCRLTSAQGELDATFESRWHSVQAQLRKRHSTPSSG
ncbi:flagellar assembly protein FliH [Vreelandella aquamarina]|uniref:flagellar assembly protein FliH n=1 Tax=Vreelandella aquamarina TaxID=77097 RepID=UPI00384B2D11